MVKLRCSRCGKELTDFLIKVESSIQVMKIAEDGTFHEYNNMAEPTSEHLCHECFNKYCDALDKLNEEYNGKYLVNMVDVIDDIQYGNKDDDTQA